MDCDRVFDILTRGPFPTGHASDHQVEAHLAQCFDCYRLAEALRPAIELFEESIPSDEGHDLPGYCGQWQPAPISLPATRRAPIAARPNASWRHRSQPMRPKLRHLLAQPVARLSVAVLAGVILAMGLRVAGLAEKPLPWDTASVVKSTSEPAAGDASQEPVVAEMLPGKGQLLRALQLAPACLGLNLDVPTASGTVTLAQLGETHRHAALQCCTNCHNEKAKGLASQAVVAIVQSCAACHQ